MQSEIKISLSATLRKCAGGKGLDFEVELFAFLLHIGVLSEFKVQLL